MKTKNSRAEIVNEIIKEISSRGRKFFNHEGEVAQLFVRNNRVWYKCEYVGKRLLKTELCLSKTDRPKGWYHGGTLLALVKDFRDFIESGNKTNNEYGYGGLFCPHWGYSEDDMKAIQQKATELGYL